MGGAAGSPTTFRVRRFPNEGPESVPDCVIIELARKNLVRIKNGALVLTFRGDKIPAIPISWIFMGCRGVFRRAAQSPYRHRKHEDAHSNGCLRKISHTRLPILQMHFFPSQPEHILTALPLLVQA